jgi:hypothetical protein
MRLSFADRLVEVWMAMSPDPQVSN